MLAAAIICDVLVIFTCMGGIREMACDNKLQFRRASGTADPLSRIRERIFIATHARVNDWSKRVVVSIDELE